MNFSQSAPALRHSSYKRRLRRRPKSILSSARALSNGACRVLSETATVENPDRSDIMRRRRQITAVFRFQLEQRSGHARAAQPRMKIARMRSQCPAATRRDFRGSHLQVGYSTHNMRSYLPGTTDRPLSSEEDPLLRTAVPIRNWRPVRNECVYVTMGGYFCIRHLRSRLESLLRRKAIHSTATYVAWPTLPYVRDSGSRGRNARTVHNPLIRCAAPAVDPDPPRAAPVDSWRPR